MYKESYDRSLLFLVFVIFIITEIFDEFLDYMLKGPSVLHSTLQLSLFIMLFVVASKLFSIFYKQKINRLIPEELMEILKIVKEAEIKGILINQTDLRVRLKITKPTLKKRLSNLIDLRYILFEVRGNHKYLILTELGNSIVK